MINSLKLLALICLLCPVLLKQGKAQTKPEMILVEGGSFQMGNPNLDPKRRDDDDEGPVHNITLNNFYIGKYEVTVKQYKEFIAANAGKTMPISKDEPRLPSPPDSVFWEEHPDAKKYYPLPAFSWWGWQDDYPMQKVNWLEAVEFCNWLSDKEGLQKCYKLNADFGVDCDINKSGYRLPTEAEWEYAARGGKKSLNTVYAGGNNVEEVCWFDETTKEMGPQKIGSKKPNELGIYDMSGNVWEWCSDYYAVKYYEQCAKLPNIKNPMNNYSTKYRVLRGGGWYYRAEYCSVTSRDGPEYGYTNFTYGFRLTKNVK